MTTGSKARKAIIPDDPDPSPTPTVVEEQIYAKDATKKRAKRTGRASQIFAGRLNRQILNFGKSKVGE